MEANTRSRDKLHSAKCWSARVFGEDFVKLDSWQSYSSLQESTSEGERRRERRGEGRIRWKGKYY
jgi:hypothetical protein